MVLGRYCNGTLGMSGSDTCYRYCCPETAIKMYCYTYSYSYPARAYKETDLTGITYSGPNNSRWALLGVTLYAAVVTSEVQARQLGHIKKEAWLEKETSHDFLKCNIRTYMYQSMYSFFFE